MPPDPSSLWRRFCTFPIKPYPNGNTASPLPDIMTLYAMCRLFGVTMEQLITSDIAERLHAIRLQAAY